MGTYETTIYTGILTTALVLGCIIAYFAFSVFKHQRKYIHLQRKYFAEEVNLLEKEKTRIARDLHDEVGPLLSFSKTRLHQLNTEDPNQALHIQKVNEQLDKVLERMGQIAINITPSSLSKKGLHFTIEQFLDDLKETYGLSIVLRYEVKSPVDLNKSLHIYRIIQEIAHNTVKHSEAQTLEIRLKERRQKLYLFCRDDGKGFSTSVNSEGHGTGSIRNRCEILYGKMKLQSNAKEGTEYFFEFPLNK